jgi:hypothetical protein
VRRRLAVWSESWRAPEARLLALVQRLRERGAAVRRGGDFDRWDLEIRGGLLGGARLAMLVEEHGAGRQLARLRAWSRVAPAAAAVAGTFAALAVAAAAGGAATAAAALGLAAVALVARALVEAGAAVGAVAEAWSNLAAAAPGAVVVAPRRAGDRAA